MVSAVGWVASWYPGGNARVHQPVPVLRYVHQMGIAHRDLKLENFLFESKADDSQIKLIDFGLSIKLPDGICL